MKSNSNPTLDGKAINQLKISAKSGKLVAVVGTGISMALTDSKIPALSWKELVKHGFVYGEAKGIITTKDRATWKNQIDSDDLDNLLCAAEFMGRKLGAPNGVLYGRWLEEVFNLVEPAKNQMARAIRALHAAGIPFCTLNYDRLLEQVTELTSIKIKETTDVTKWMAREKSGVLHLHGSWDDPSTCIFGIRDYETSVGNDARDLIQRALASFSHLLFLGCGDTFADPNFSALIRWLSEKLKTAAPLHYALVSADQADVRNRDANWHGFVEPISYGADRADLPAFLLKLFRRMAKKDVGPREVPPKLRFPRKHPIGDDKEHSFYVKSTHAKYIMGEDSSELCKFREIRALKDVDLIRIDRIPTILGASDIGATKLFPITQECFSMPGVAFRRNEYYYVVLGADQLFKANNDYSYFIIYKLRQDLDVIHDNPKKDFVQFEKPLGREMFVVEVHFPPTRKLKRVNRKVQLSVHEVRRSDPNSIDGKVVRKEIESARYMINADEPIETIPGRFTDMFRLTLLNPPQEADYIRITWQWSRNAEI